MKAAIAIAALVCSAACTGADRMPAAAASCAASETTYFQCVAAKGRSINLCGGDGALQYRYGRGRAVELAFPASAGDGARQFRFAHYFRARTDRFEIRFENQGVEYVIFDHQEEGRRSAGVRVERGGSEHDVVCTGPVTSRLADLQNVVPCDTESALNLGQCR